MAKDYLFKPGQSGNPKGRPKLDEQWAKIGRLTKDHLNGIVSKYGKMTYDELKLAVTDNQTPVIELCIARIYVQTLESGESGGLNMLLDRAIGRPAVQPNEIDLRRIADQEKRTQIAADMAKIRAEQQIADDLSGMSDQQIDELLAT